LVLSCFLGTELPPAEVGAEAPLALETPKPAKEVTTLQSALNLIPTHVRRASRTRLQFLERRLQRQKADLPPVHELDRLRQRAEGLRANIYMWPKGFSQWHVPPEIIESAGLPAILTLKAGQSPGDVVTAAFDELDKLLRRRGELEKRVEESRLALERFEELVQHVGGDLGALPEEVLASQILLAQEVRHLVSVQRLLTQLELTWSPTAERTAALEAERERRLPYRSYRASSGEFIRVSKSAADADAMLKLMPAHHTWVHVMTGEGSHVWLEKPKGAKPSDAALREAAMLAIHHSKQTRAQEADVYIALRGDLDKRKDLPAGKVIVRRSDHRFVRYSQIDLQSFLDTQNG
jgi:predicted ribosome quality control (RQC) complex YloA/Tae2 family protein